MPVQTISQQLRDIINPQFHQNNFKEEIYIKNGLGIKLDKDEQICQLALTPSGCPLGPLHCPLRHTLPSTQNFQPPKPLPTHPKERERLSTVCKHWLRGLCKKGEACEFLHEYNLRKMPECWWFAKYGVCSAGDDCLYSHTKDRKARCPDYDRGFCRLGPNCPRKHLRRVACQLPKPHLPNPEDYNPPSVDKIELGPPPPGFNRFGDPSTGQLQPGGMPGFQRRNLDEVICFKCGEKGHYANHCRNRAFPGGGGGMGRGGGRKFDD
ncbi:hypothetical protein DL96DRAFT_1612122 [Flagelloscypha sp. PMI_526]|nr:hypothetical protein DL96DRAFT_1612122 [Flagelloscypha sp. PMI_526]